MGSRHTALRRRGEGASSNGLIYIAIDPVGKLAVVNVLSAERLLEGVVPSELTPPRLSKP